MVSILEVESALQIQANSINGEIIQSRDCLFAQNLVLVLVGHS
jgi:hypothetical protein